MAELETEVDVQDTDYELDVQDTQDDTTEEEITYEQALQWKEEAKREREARLKAEKSIVEKKKELAKKTSTQSPIDVKEAFKQIREEEKFFDKNPDAESYRDKIEEYKKQGLTLEEWYSLASKKDEYVNSTREVYWTSIVWQTADTSWLKVISSDTFDSMTRHEQAKYTDDMIKKYGAVKFK